MIYDELYRNQEVAHRDEIEREMRQSMLVPALLSQFQTAKLNEKCDGWSRMRRCRRALDAMDHQGWQRSLHQMQFHDQFIRASVRVFWKTEPQGQFARDHKKILELNGWESLPQEFLISTPRRFGKTISVSMFAAAMMYSAPQVEVSIYSTCQRISQKLLENIWKFIKIVFEGLDERPFTVLRRNMEQLVLQGPEGSQDVRKVNSYPSTVGRPSLDHTHSMHMSSKSEIYSETNRAGETNSSFLSRIISSLKERFILIKSYTFDSNIHQLLLSTFIIKRFIWTQSDNFRCMLETRSFCDMIHNLTIRKTHFELKTYSLV